MNKYNKENKKQAWIQIVLTSRPFGFHPYFLKLLAWISSIKKLISLFDSRHSLLPSYSRIKTVSRVSTSLKVSEYEGKRRERRNGNCKHALVSRSLPVWTKTLSVHPSTQKQRHINMSPDSSLTCSPGIFCNVTLPDYCSLVPGLYPGPCYQPGESLHDAFSDSSLSHCLEPRWYTQSSRAAVSPLWEGGSLPCRERSAGGILWGWALPPVSSSALGVVFMWLPSPLPLVAVESLGYVWFFTTPWTATHQASLSFNTSQSLLKLMSIESVMPSNHLILCHHLLLLSSIFPSIKVFSNESALHVKRPKYWSFSFGSAP